MWGKETLSPAGSRGTAPGALFPISPEKWGPARGPSSCLFQRREESPPQRRRKSQNHPRRAPSQAPRRDGFRRKTRGDQYPRSSPPPGTPGSLHPAQRPPQHRQPVADALGAAAVVTSQRLPWAQGVLRCSRRAFRGRRCSGPARGPAGRWGRFCCAPPGSTPSRGRRRRRRFGCRCRRCSPADRSRPGR